MKLLLGIFLNVWFFAFWFYGFLVLKILQVLIKAGKAGFKNPCFFGFKTQENQKVLNFEFFGFFII
jgi:hypothetical protein